MNENIAESFDKLIWHDSKLRFLRILRNGDVDEVLLDVELRGMPGQELVPMTVVLEDAVFFFSDIDLQGKRECSDDISSAKCASKTDLMNKVQKERVRYSPDAPAEHFHFFGLPDPARRCCGCHRIWFQIGGPDERVRRSSAATKRVSSGCLHRSVLRAARRGSW